MPSALASLKRATCCSPRVWTSPHTVLHHHAQRCLSATAHTQLPGPLDPVRAAVQHPRVQQIMHAGLHPAQDGPCTLQGSSADALSPGPASAGRPCPTAGAGPAGRAHAWASKRTPYGLRGTGTRDQVKPTRVAGVPTPARHTQFTGLRAWGLVRRQRRAAGALQARGGPEVRRPLSMTTH